MWIRHFLLCSIVINDIYWFIMCTLFTLLVKKEHFTNVEIILKCFKGKKLTSIYDDPGHSVLWLLLFNQKKKCMLLVFPLLLTCKEIWRGGEPLFLERGGGLLFLERGDWLTNSRGSRKYMHIPRVLSVFFKREGDISYRTCAQTQS